MRFGWFDFIDDTEVSEALIAKGEGIGHDPQMEFMEGPVGFSNMDKVGVLVEGFDHIGTMITWYNHPYYQTHYERLGFVKEKGYMENKFPNSNADPVLFKKLNESDQETIWTKGNEFYKNQGNNAMGRQDVRSFQ